MEDHANLVEVTVKFDMAAGHLCTLPRVDARSKVGELKELLSQELLDTGNMMDPGSMSLVMEDVVMFDGHNFMGYLPELLPADGIAITVVLRTPVMAGIRKALKESF